jgi:hypothetical protein
MNWLIAADGRTKGSGGIIGRYMTPDESTESFKGPLAGLFRRVIGALSEVRLGKGLERGGIVTSHGKSERFAKAPYNYRV